MQKDSGKPTVVSHPEHIKRLHTEGWRIVGDPRVQSHVQPLPPQENTDELKAEIERLRAQLAQQQEAPKPADVDPVPISAHKRK